MKIFFGVQPKKRNNIANPKLTLRGNPGQKGPDNALTAITHHTFELRSPNLLQMCIWGSTFRTLKKMVLVYLDLQGHMGT